MLRILRSLADNILSFRGAFATGLTDKTTLQSLVHKLYPKYTDKRLIRLGPNCDGGYLVPDDLDGIEACFSPGVSLSSGFEKDCADLGMRVFLADHSVDKPAESHELFHFTKKHVGAIDGDNFMTVNDWVEASLPRSQSDLMLQIDIEGYEYETFFSISDQLMRRFRIIVGEFHHLNELWNLPFFRLASRVFEKILQTHTCVHIHPNNCYPPFSKWGLSIPPLAEFTFLRHDRVCNPSDATIFPHPLDVDNTDRVSFPLPACWYRNQ